MRTRGWRGSSSRKCDEKEVGVVYSQSKMLGDIDNHFVLRIGRNATVVQVHPVSVQSGPTSQCDSNI
jgi:hypothetical protein